MVGKPVAPGLRRVLVVALAQAADVATVKAVAVAATETVVVAARAEIGRLAAVPEQPHRQKNESESVTTNNSELCYKRGGGSNHEKAES
jgi:hypothetical protein